MNLVVETSTQGHPENPQPDPAPPTFPDPTHPDPQEPELPPVDPPDPGSSVPKADVSMAHGPVLNPQWCHGEPGTPG